MKATTFLDVDVVLTIHQRMIQEFGGGSGLRDSGLLESAVAMPSAVFGGQFLHDDLASMTGAYLFHLCKNHPFVDGNKRVALATAITFLLFNDYELTCAKPDAEQLTLGVADGSISKDEAIAFFRKHVRSAKSVKAKLEATATPAKRGQPRRKKSS